MGPPVSDGRGGTTKERWGMSSRRIQSCIYALERSTLERKTDPTHWPGVIVIVATIAPSISAAVVCVFVRLWGGVRGRV